MGIMVSEVYEALVEAGASEAKAAAEAIPLSEQLATKTDLGAVKADLAEVKASLKADIGEAKTEIAALEAKVWRAGVAIAALAVLFNKFLDWMIR